MFLISPVGRVEKVWWKVSPKATPIELMSALEDIGE